MNYRGFYFLVFTAIRYLAKYQLSVYAMGSHNSLCKDLRCCQSFVNEKDVMAYAIIEIINNGVH